ncbi:MAG: methylenetetrahydrofolate reductase [NAD(P)H] [Clostridiales bacterium]|nr:methylenetetrahydrofolate reductase [NAD(P)H] [Clostridiales bacterium]
MSISDLFVNKKPVFSLEIFPPKKNGSIDTIYDTLDGLKDIKPDFISVTYGAGGNLADSSTIDICSIIKNNYNITPIAHLTCVNSTKDDISVILKRLKEKGIDNILALRGDINPEIPPKDDFKYANELVAYIKTQGDFGISAACYPEGHIQSATLVDDVLNVKKKVEAGAEHLISQLFFDNKFFYDFREKSAIAGINVPIEAGIMPVINKNQIERMVSMCGASLPPKFTKMCSRFANNPEALRDAGIAYAIDQIIDLISNDVDGIHLYTMNNPYVAKKIFEAIEAMR